MESMPLQNLPVPNHVVIIPDGNRRWATARGLEPWEGHEAGAKITETLARAAKKLGVRELSFWGSSMENLTKRPLKESQALLRIYAQYFKELLESEEVYTDQTRIRFIGHWEEQFPGPLKDIIRRCTEETRNHDRTFLNFFLAYSGDDDMRRAIQAIADAHQAGTQVTDATIKNALMTRDLPSVDYLIRTGGEPHLSAGFMMWDTANSQLYFSEKNYPDFDEKCFEEAIIEYGRRERRFGK